ncbi:putative hydroxymethylpyrimidine transporter CytX [Veillonella parvula]|uniref:putative hydroxymethylpyrimidine transporter CytX n=1 Tax=Veillonella parvula TaxID=29466 RepID=UPI00241DFF03|nr:putative hydroxymethylpyrimidine transporter CytX [Veillonella parvula]MBS7178097.1 putative hydroxymethylpyrimidine transporter CytX [Veillonella parvula]
MTDTHITQPQFAMIWFGAALSIAEIMTGTYLAPLGLTQGLYAIILGHIIGGILLFGAGLIGGRLRQGSMNTTAFSFGPLGAKGFAFLNMIQLIGWTSIMIYDAMLALQELAPLSPMIWTIAIGALVILWLFIGLHNTGYIQAIVSVLLLGLTLYMGVHMISQWPSDSSFMTNGNMSFIAALELSIAMPLSWLPLISDYTRESKSPFSASLTSAAIYTVTSVAMYTLGLSAAIFGGGDSIITIMMNAGLGLTGLIVIIFSTVTTTFMDAYSAGVSSTTIYNGASSKGVAVIVTIVGAIAAILYPMDDITEFLYLIGSVFTPMIAILLADYFMNRQQVQTLSAFLVRGTIWAVSVGLYHYMLHSESTVGATLPAFTMAFIITTIIGFVSKAVKVSTEVKQP